MTKRRIRTEAHKHLALAGCLTLAACIGNIGGSGDPTGTGNGVDDDANVPSTGWADVAMRRLTSPQYEKAVGAVFGEQILVTSPLDEDESTELFLSMGAAKVGTSERGVEQYHDAALDIAEQVMANVAEQDVLATCTPFQPGDVCIEDAVVYYGTRLWRRDMSDEEVAAVVAVQNAVTDDTAEPSAVWAIGMTHAIATLIASPNFVYLPEVGEQVPESEAWRYTGVEMASRLSFVLWGSIPDEELRRAARDGELVTRKGVRAQATRMLDAPQAADLATRFFGEAWKVAGLAPTDKNLEVYPEWTPELVSAFQTEFDLFLRELTSERDGDLRDVLVGDTTFANDLLGSIYGMSTAGSEFATAKLQDGRTGLLTSGAVMAAISPSDRTSPTGRGLFVLENLLCEEVPPPPANVDDTLEAPDVSDAETLRDKLEQHRADPVCASCHDMLDPLGFTFENYDAIGKYREVDGGRPIDSSGELEDVTFEGAQDLANYVAKDPRFTACLTERFFAFAAGHIPADGESVVMEEVTGDLRDHYQFKQLVLDLVTSPAFRFLEPAKKEGNGK